MLSQIMMDFLTQNGFRSDALDCLKHTGIKQLREIQKEAIELGLFDDYSFLISAPSGIGKTLIGEFALIHQILSKQKKAVYLVPLKALATDKFDHFRTTYEKLNLNIVMAVGDQDVPLNVLNNANLLIMTYEKFDSYLRNIKNMQWIDSVATIIIDEVHFLGDNKRGSRLENLIIRIYRMKNPPQLINLSATIANPEVIRKWFEMLEKKYRQLDFKYISEFVRPVELNYKIISSGNKMDKIEQICKYYLEKQGQIIIFTNSRRDTQICADKLVGKLSYVLPKHNLDTFFQKSELNFNELSSELVDFIQNGVAYHHAGLNQAERTLIESFYLEGIIKIICATSTLSAGVNTPARVIILKDFRVFQIKNFQTDENSIASRSFMKIPMERNLFHQICGRAGRPGYDTEGYAYILTDDVEQSIWVEDFYFTKTIHGNLSPKYENLQSILPENDEILHEIVLLKIFETENFTSDSMVEFIQDSLMWHQVIQKTIPIEAFLNLAPLSFLVLLKTLGKKDYYIFFKQLHFDFQILSYVPNKILKIQLTYKLNHQSKFFQLGYESDLISSNLKNLVTTHIERNHHHSYTIIFSKEKGILCTCGQKSENYKFASSQKYPSNQKIPSFPCIHQVMVIYCLNSLIGTFFFKTTSPDIDTDLTYFEHEILSQKDSLELFIYHCFYPTSIIEQLREYRLIKEQEMERYSYKCTALGKIALKCYILPRIAHFLSENITYLLSIKSKFILEDFIPILKETLKLNGEREIPPLFEILSMWIQEYSSYDIVEVLISKNSGFHIYPSDILSITDRVARYFKFIYEFVEEFHPNHHYIVEFEILYYQIKYGIMPDLIPWVVSFKNEDIRQFRCLIKNGINKPEQLLQKDPKKIASKTQFSLKKIEYLRQLLLQN